MNSKTIAEYLGTLQQKWTQLHNSKNIFAYLLNINAQKWVEGSFGFYAELNENRANLRRTPQVIRNLNTKFNAEEFNFNKINSQELLLNIRHENCEISFIINKSPLTQYHMLICPDISAGYPQKLTFEALNFSINYVRQLDAQHAAFRIGYNSPGALASVNHLHLHVVNIDKHLYIDKVKLQLLADNYVYRLSEEMPTEAICFIFHRTDSDEGVLKKLKKLYDFISWINQQDWPHNLFISASRDLEFSGALKVFVFARSSYCTVKDQFALNIGFCELSGFIVVGDKNIYENLTEQLVLDRIKSETGDVFASIYKYFL